MSAITKTHECYCDHASLAAIILELVNDRDISLVRDCVAIVRTHQLHQFPAIPFGQRKLRSEGVSLLCFRFLIASLHRFPFLERDRCWVPLSVLYKKKENEACCSMSGAARYCLHLSLLLRGVTLALLFPRGCMCSFPRKFIDWLAGVGRGTGRLFFLNCMLQFLRVRPLRRCLFISLSSVQRCAVLSLW